MRLLDSVRNNGFLLSILLVFYLFAISSGELESTTFDPSSPNTEENLTVTETSTNVTEQENVSIANVVTSDEDLSPVEHHSVSANEIDQILQLQSENTALASRIALLESKLGKLEGLLDSVKLDVQFHHPTIEVQYVDMQILQWNDASLNGLRKMAIQFQAGYSLGAVSTWEFSLANESDSLTINLLLVEEKYGKGALFAGFTAYVLDANGNVYSQANALPVNFLDGNGRNLHLPNVIPLKEIRNSSSGLLSDDGVFKIRFRLELLGVGHKLYSENPLGYELHTKDTQTVVFDVDDIFGKIAKKLEGLAHEKKEEPLAYTRFGLKHDAWNMETNWIAELHTQETNDEGETLSLNIILENYPSPELYASFQVEVWDFLNKRLIQTQVAPINNFANDRITIDPLLIMNQLKEVYDEDEALSLRFKLHFAVYSQNARYYSDVV